MASLGPSTPTRDELKAARALATATASLLSATQPENMEEVSVCVHRPSNLAMQPGLRVEPPNERQIIGLSLAGL